MPCMRACNSATCLASWNCRKSAYCFASVSFWRSTSEACCARNARNASASLSDKPRRLIISSLLASSS